MSMGPRVYRPRRAGRHAAISLAACIAWCSAVAHAQEADFIGTTRTRIEAPSPSAGAQFGFPAVAGDSVFVGAQRAPRPTTPGGDSSSTGRVYRYEKGAAGWAFSGELAPSTTTMVPREFGNSLFGYENLLLVAAQGEGIAGAAEHFGAIYVFERDRGGPSAWGLSQRLENPHPHHSAQYGYSLATDGQWLVAGSLNIPDGTGAAHGAAFVYRRGADGTFRLVQTLRSPDGAARNFGSGVSVSDGHIAVTDYGAGAHGHVYIFARNAAGSFVHAQSLEPTAVPCPSAPTGRCYFSFKVALYKTTLFASAHPNDDLYWFERNASTWNLARRMRPISAPDFAVGNWLAMHPGLVLASGAAAGGGVGAAYLFYQHHPERGRGYGLVATLLPEHARTGTGFGQPVALGHRVAVVGAAHDSVRGEEAGAAYIYDLLFASPPRFDSTLTHPIEAPTGRAFSYAIRVSDPDRDALQITAPTLPAWLTLIDHGDGTGTLAGTPTDSHIGSHAVTLRVTDTTGRAAEQSFNVPVLDARAPPPMPMSSRGCGCSAPGTATTLPGARWTALLLALSLAGRARRRKRLRERSST